MRNRASIGVSFAIRSRYFRAAVLLLLFGVLTACKTSQEAINAANQLTSASQQLDAYYIDLEQQINDTVSLNEIQSQMLGVPFEQVDRDQLDTTRQELAKRAAMAHALGTLAQAYAGLAGSKAGTDIGTAASALSNELAGMKAIPNGPAIGDLVTQASTVLVELVRAHKLQQSSGKIAEIVNKVNLMFQKESSTYESINQQRIVLAESLAVLLVEKDMVDVSPALAPALKPFALNSKLPSGKTPAEVRKVAEAEITSRGAGEISDYDAGTEALSATLSATAKQVAAVARAR